MIDSCETCPLKSDCHPLHEPDIHQQKEVYVGINRGFIFLSYVINKGLSIRRHSLNLSNDRSPEKEFAASIKACTAPETVKIPFKGFLGKLGLTKTVRICPAIEEHFDPREPESVRQFVESHIPADSL